MTPVPISNPASLSHLALNASGYPVITQTQGTEGGVRNERQERDALGRLLRSDTQHSTRTFSYNRLDQITEVTLTPTEAGERLHHMQADTVRFAYDRSGWLTTFSGYNADNRLSWQRSLPDGSQNPQQAGKPPAQNDSVTARDYIWNADGEVGV